MNIVEGLEDLHRERQFGPAIFIRIRELGYRFGGQVCRGGAVLLVINFINPVRVVCG
ncbi:hypothetical protein X772_32085 [Mesorhizobium sp. LSJC280B00]|nr:hypothetical protein X772_32085 [Mesorhizobium sp. LSJC280B00]